MKTAIELIELERANQRSLGYDAAHDDEHDRCELIDAAICYAHSAALAAIGGCGYDDCSDHWPFEEEAWKPSEDPIKGLVKSISMLVAEVERLQRLGENAESIHPESKPKEYANREPESKP